MKVLMTKGWEEPEYLDDGMLHGMRALFGNDVVEYPRMRHMYANEFGPGKRDLSSIAARGFTYYGMMDDSGVDRTDLESKIRNGYFDLTLMHPWYPSTLTGLVLEHTPRNKMAWLDGRDEQQVLGGFVETGIYFKRELVRETKGVLPISFGIPEEKIRMPAPKTMAVAHCVPGDLNTYIYYDEDSYYQQYNRALFGITRKKNGWDCLRHYEIMAARSVPWFLDLGFCPQMTCTTLPKRLLLTVNDAINQHGAETFMHGHMKEWYEDVRQRIHGHFLMHCTTTRLARYVIDNLG